MLISYKLIVCTLIIVLALILLSIYFKRNQRKYSPVLKNQIVELTDQAIDHLEKSKAANNPLIALQEASYAFGIWDSVKKIATDEDLPQLVDTNTVELNKQIKIQFKKSLNMNTIT